MKKIINAILSPLGLRLCRKSNFDNFIRRLEQYDRIYRNYPFSKSQLQQDLFVLSELGFKRDGFFVEFGATNGVDLSNSHLLEAKFGWTGILAEPARVWHSELRTNRTAAVETDCVWKKTGETLWFNEVEVGALSTLDRFSGGDLHKDARKHGHKYEVSTISLLDLLMKHKAPQKIDYLSIDTEGSEYDILNAFDFDAFDIKIITCEHNFTPMRGKIFKLLTKHGYERKYAELSWCDDWYVRR